MTRYLNSEFLEGAKADQLVAKFNNAIEALDQSKLIQISLDGLSVNLKFLSIINEQREGDRPPLVDIGTCGLHTIQGSLKNGIIFSGWKIDDVLRWVWSLLKELQPEGISTEKFKLPITLLQDQMV